MSIVAQKHVFVNEGMLNPKVFKAYDIRGVYGVDWDADGAGCIVDAFVRVFGVRRLVLGWDMRLSSPDMVAAIERAARAAGAVVVRVGQVTTPMLYFATAGYDGNDAGIMVTASHNTGEWNGMKLLLGNGMPVGEASGLLDVKALACAPDSVPRMAPQQKGIVSDRDIRDDYVRKIFSMASLDETRPLSVVIDCGNGMEGAIVHRVLAQLPMVTAHVMYDTPDGSFPHHEANPLKHETLHDLQREVVARGAACGIAFDGDGDRVGFVDERGNVIGGDVLTGLVACELLKNAEPRTPVLFDLRSRRAVVRAIEAAGGSAQMSRVGHAFIKKQMREAGALFAGELSCHFYFRDFYNVECADAMMLLVMQLLQNGAPLSEQVAGFLSDAHSGEMNFEVADRDVALKMIEDHFAPQARDVSRLDGLLFDMGDWWFNVRASNTEPLLRLNAEASTSEALARHVATIIALIK